MVVVEVRHRTMWIADREDKKEAGEAEGRTGGGGGGGAEAEGS